MPFERKALGVRKERDLTNGAEIPRTGLGPNEIPVPGYRQVEGVPVGPLDGMPDRVANPDFLGLGCDLRCRGWPASGPRRRRLPPMRVLNPNGPGSGTRK